MEKASRYESQNSDPEFTSILVDINTDGPLAIDVMERVELPDGRIVLTGSGPVPK